MLSDLLDMPLLQRVVINSSRDIIITPTPRGRICMLGGAWELSRTAYWRGTHLSDRPTERVSRRGFCTGEFESVCSYIDEHRGGILVGPAFPRLRIFHVDYADCASA